MSRVVLAVAVASLFGVVAGGQAPAPQQPTFRSTTDLVSVDAIVRSGGDAVGGLTASDFVLLDNGVTQRIESVEATAVPVDLTLVVDVSGGDPVWWGTPRPGPEIAGRLTDIVRRAGTVLRADDRLRLLTIDTYATQVLPIQPVTTPVKVERVASDGLSSLQDALAAALLQAVEPDRRHLVVAFTKADDTISTIDAQTLGDLARRSDAVLHVVAGESLVGNTQCLLPTSAADPGDPRPRDPCTFPKKRFWRPVHSHDLDVLAEIAPLTGGAFHRDATGLEFRDFSGIINDVLTEFRHGYVLRYTPQNVKRDGWHEIKVSVPATPAFTIQARRGYAIEPPAPPRAVTRPASPPAVNSGAPPPATIESLLETYGRGDPAAVQTMVRETRDLSKLIRDVNDAGSLLPGQPRREAIFVLEVAMAALKREDAATRAEVDKLLAHYDTLVRQPLGADAFECTWHWAVVAGLEGVIRPAGVMPLLTRAQQRCPDDHRLVLAAAMLADQKWPLGTVRSPVPPSSGFAAHIADVTSRYETAMKFPETAAEARVRAAWFFYRVGKFDDARRLLDGVEDLSPDRQILYMALLVRGHVLRAQGQFDAAAGALRAALATWPTGQSARVALMTLLLHQGDRQQSASLAEAVQSAPDGPVDPWWLYWEGDDRVYPAIVAKLREMAQ